MKWIAIAGVAVLASACVATETETTPASTPLGADDANIAAASWSPDGSRVAYWVPTSEGAGGRQLWIANADFSEPRALQVTSGTFFAEAWPAIWSPDGERLAVLSGDFSSADIALVQVRDGAVTRLTSGAGVEIPVSWTGNGSTIGYIASAQGGKITSFNVDVASGAITPMVPGEERPYLAVRSPDGRHIAYLVLELPYSSVWVADSAGNSPRQLAGAGYYNLSLTGAWSPDSRKIVYESRRTGTSDIWVISVDSGPARQLTRDIRNDVLPFWSPDGKWIAFRSDRGRQTDVWVVPASGGEEIRVTDTPEEEGFFPVWVPGRPATVAFPVLVEQSGVWAMDLATGAERRLTPDSVRANWFNVSNGGDQVSVVVPRGGGVDELAVVPIAGGPMRTLVAATGTVDRGWWAPNDSLLLFGSDRSGSWDAWVVDVASGASRNVTPWPESWEYRPTWTGDGRVVFHSDRTKPFGDLWTVSAAGGEPVQLTRSGGIAELWARGSTILAATWGQRAGQIDLFAVGSGGELRSLWDRSNIFASAVSYDGAWVSAEIEQPDGRTRGAILSVRSGAQRPMLEPGETFGDWSRDGTRILYHSPVDGVAEVGVLTIADGSKRRLTTTPEAEGGAEFTPDGNTVVFRRTKRIQRMHMVDLSSVLVNRD